MLTPFNLSADVWALAQAADKAAMRGVLQLVPGTDVAAQSSLDGKLNLTGGTLTGQLVLNNASTTGALNLSPTWNNAGTAFNLIYGRVTNTASAAASNLIDVGTVAAGSLFKVTKAGDVIGTSGPAGGLHLRNNTSHGVEILADNIYCWDASNLVASINRSSVRGFSTTWNGVFAFGTSTTNANGLGADVILCRDAAGVLALKNGTAAQTLRVYGTATGNRFAQLAHDGTNAILSASSGTIRLQGSNRSAYIALPTTTEIRDILISHGLMATT